MRIERQRVVLACGLAALLSGCGGSAQSSGPPAAQASVAGPAAPPPLFLKFSDLESGPRDGGQGGKGAFVTVWGSGFGPTRGDSFVTVGGGAADGYPVWTDSRVSFQLGPAAATGEIVMHVGGQRSNGLPFTVRSGRIYFVSPQGKDDAGGSHASPWRTVVKAKNTLSPGDLAYVMDGVAQTAQDNYEAALSIESAGAPGRPKALLAYPGARPTIGSTATSYGLRVPNIEVAGRDWVIAGFVLVGWQSAIALGGDAPQRWRIVGNRISCPPGTGQTGCVTTSGASHVQFLGNEVTDTGQAPASVKQYHAVYFSTDSNHIEVGWNWIHDNRTCHAIQFHSSPLCWPACGAADRTGRNQYDLVVHDNLIHGDLCSGINFATVDPSQGRVEAYNNVIHDVGNGPPPSDGLSGANCVYSPGYTNNGPPGRGAVEVYHNTCVDVGRAGTHGPGGAFLQGESPGLVMQLRNNVVVQAGGPYLAPWSAAGAVRGSHNLWFGQGGPPGGFSESLSGDPLFADRRRSDFRLGPGSPAQDAGTGTGLARDLEGRPRDARPDLGAYEAPRP
jgi:hypothetical protein